jgi:hypothetical protein
MSEVLDKLVSYPIYHMEGYVDDDEECGEEIEVERRGTIVVKYHGNNDGKHLFVLGESVCSLQDNFQRRTGRLIAEGRCNKVDCGGVILFTLEEGEKIITLSEEYGLNDDGDPFRVCNVTLPISGSPLPFGVCKRLRKLIPT